MHHHSPAHHAKALRELFRRFGTKDTELWPFVGMVWCGTETVDGNDRDWSYIWDQGGGWQGLAMNEDERVQRSMLPKEITVWCGRADDKGPLGFLWTVNERDARCNALRVATVDNPGKVIEGKVRKEDVVALFNRKGYSEIIAPRSVKLNGTRLIKVKADSDEGKPDVAITS